MILLIIISSFWYSYCGTQYCVLLKLFAEYFDCCNSAVVYLAQNVVVPSTQNLSSQPLQTDVLRFGFIPGKNL